MRVVEFVLLLTVFSLSSFRFSQPVDLKNSCDRVLSNVTLQRVYIGHVAEDLQLIGYPEWMKPERRYVECARRGLTAVPDQLPRDIEILDLSINVIQRFTKRDFEKYTDLVGLFLVGNCARESSYNMPYCSSQTYIELGAFENLTKLKLLDFSLNILKDFPQKLPPSLEILDISGTGIENTTKADVAYLNNLTVFAADRICDGSPPTCKVDPTIEDGAFETLNRTLLVLSLWGNYFKAIPAGLLTYNLLSFDMDLNYIRNINQHQFGTSPFLRRLSLSAITGFREPLDLHPGFLDGLVYLEYLDLSLNKMTSLPDNLFLHNRNLRFLDLTGNCLWKFVENPTFLAASINLQFLHLGYNEVCPTGSFSDGILSDKVLRLGHSFENMSNLRLLSFGRTSKFDTVLVDEVQLRLGAVDNQSLSVLKALPKLSQLVLAYCNINSFDFSSLTGFAALGRLSLSNNRIGTRNPNFLRRKNDRIRTDDILTSSHSISPIRVKMPSSTAQHPVFGASQDGCDDTNSLLLSFNEIYTLSREQFETTSFASWLDLSSNFITQINEMVFVNMPGLCRIDIRSNPVEFIHPFAFVGLPKLKSLALNSTRLMRTPISFLFLKNLESPISFQYAYSGSTLFSALVFVRNLQSTNVTTIDFSNNELGKIQVYAPDLFDNFPNIRSLTLKACRIFDSQIYFNNWQLTTLDLSDNFLTEIPMLALKNLPKLTHLSLSRNRISLLKTGLFRVSSNLQYLDISYNEINFISPGLFDETNNLKFLILRNNYISRVDNEILPLHFLESLVHLDLRWNPIACQCKLTENLGRWLSRGPFDLVDRPGVLPVCSSVIDEYFGGCMKCRFSSASSSSDKSLMRFCANQTCGSYAYALMCSCFTTFVVVFEAAALIFTSRKWKLWLVKYAMKEVTVQRERTDSSENRTSGEIFAYHGCVVFDKHDNKAGDWVDEHLIPTMCEKPPYFRLVVNGRDDQCGSTPVKQLLFQIQASRKIIVILTGDFGRTSEGRYLLSLLENLKYQSGNDRVIAITFENDDQSGGWTRMRNKRKRWSMLRVPDSQEKWSLFWVALEAAIKMP